MDNNNKHKTKKNNTLAQLFVAPFVFVLIALVVIVPMFIGGFSFAKTYVNKARESFTMSYGDLVPNDKVYAKHLKKGEKIDKKELEVAGKVGELSCDNAAIGCDVYYGINRASKRYGVAASAKSGLFGDGGEIRIDGDVSSEFKALKNVKKGDVFTVNAPEGEYKYTVVDVTTAQEYTKKLSGEYLLLSTEVSSDAFAHQAGQRLFVAATIGAEEVE
ncbi:MAG: hypothetical protein IJS03_00755 [Eubacterium sp.]|nr:hypothetical protein [Eubacterium sp.]